MSSALKCPAEPPKGLALGNLRRHLGLSQITMADSPIIAAVIHRATNGVDDLISSFALSLIAQGWRVRGLIQEMCDSEHGCSITLVDIDDGICYTISQNLGQLSQACSIDTGNMAEAGAVMRRIAHEGADLAIFNRFSKLEADGQGFSAEMLDLAVRGIPVLTIVPEKHLGAWRNFTGGLGSELEASHSVLENWFLGLNAPASGHPSLTDR